MAEGPSIVILAERAARFVDRTIERAEGNAPIAIDRLVGRRVLGLRTFGKHCPPRCVIRGIDAAAAKRTL